MVLSLPYKEYSHLREHSREIHSAVCCTWFWAYRTKNTPNYANIHGKFIFGSMLYMVLSLPYKEYSHLHEHSWKFIQQYAVHGFESTVQRILALTRTFTGNSFSSKLYMVWSLPYKEYSHLREHSREIHSAVCHFGAHCL